jgi:3-hydroxybutyrate dehydrogenase
MAPKDSPYTPSLSPSERFYSSVTAPLLQGRKAVVTGSTSGIGLGIVRALAAEGASIVLSGSRVASEAEELRADLTDEFGVAVHYEQADLSQTDECDAFIARCQERLGAIDILVNNAGIQFTAPVEEFPVERWNRIIALNLSAAFYTIRAALPGMKKRGWGRLINIGSTHSLVASANKAAYVAAKHGLIGLTKVIALETADTGITCNAICPGWVLTPLVQAQIDARAVKQGVSAAMAERDLLSEKQPSLRFTTVDQIGALAVFLCGEGASNMTGSALPVDGGWTAC